MYLLQEVKLEAVQYNKKLFMHLKYSAPKTGSTGFFLASPDVFQIAYLYNGPGEHPFLNKFKELLLRV